jgi:type IV pilus assembly protein PilA
MKNMIVAQKEQLKKRGVKGFTLMEMLIVVAIIAILVAIAIPIFSGQLDNAKYSADEANGRSLYAAVTADYMTTNTVPTWTQTDKKVTYNGTTYEFSDKNTSVTSGTNANGAPTVTVNDGTDHTYTFGD